jgi:hypothetical protein
MSSFGLTLLANELRSYAKTRRLPRPAPAALAAP